MPEGLRQLPPDRYLVEYVEELDELTPGEEVGIIEALDDLEAGHGIALEQVRREITAGLPRERSSSTTERPGRS